MTAADEGHTAEKAQGHHFRHRVETLSDGVFAIALTLLALELRAPASWDGTVGGFFKADAGPLSAYGVGFVVIGNYWLAHRRMLAPMRTVDTPFAILNLLQLALICLMPAATALLWQRGGIAPVPLYVGLVWLIGLAQGLSFAYSRFLGELVADRGPLRLVLFRLFSIAILPGVTTALAFYSAIHGSVAGAIALAVIIAAVRLAGRRLRRSAAGVSA